MDTKFICLECLKKFETDASFCTRCGSPRIFNATAFPLPVIAHVDCDAFFASVEKARRPELRDAPLIIGGGRRGVVSTACYLARVTGVRSAMPMFKAKRLCPDAVVLKPDMTAYRTASTRIRTLMCETGADVEPVSIDEAYLDISTLGNERILRLAQLAHDIEASIGVTVSIGAGPNRFVAKLAGGISKPRGFTVMSQEEAQSYLENRSVADLRGVGPRTARKLALDGFPTVAHLRSASKTVLERRYGAFGARLHDLARAEDRTTVVAHATRKSVSSERTFPEDLGDLESLRRALQEVAVLTEARAAKAGVLGRTSVLKLKTHRHEVITRSVSGEPPIRDAGAVFERLEPHLASLHAQGPFRLIGAGLSGLVSEDDPSLASRLPLEQWREPS